MEVWNDVESTAGRLMCPWSGDYTRPLLITSAVKEDSANPEQNKWPRRFFGFSVLWSFSIKSWFGSQLFLEKHKIKLAELMQSWIYT